MRPARIRKTTALRLAGLASASAALLVIGPVSVAPAISEATDRTLPKPPANGMMGFVVSEFIPPVIQGKDACPQGPALKLKDTYLSSLSPEERARLSLKENEAELTKRWQAGIFGANGTNICSQPDLFTRPAMRTVQSPNAFGLDLDDGAPGDEGCAHEEFTSPAGEKGIDNQEYRVMGCTLEWRGVDGVQGDIASGMRQFFASGEWTQVILLRGVDSLENDDSVEVIYGNTPDRPMADSTGKFLPGASFTISDKPPRNRNVLHGRIADGVLTTDAGDVVLTQTWGQGGARDIRGNRTKFDYRKARLRLTFQPDGSVKGMLGGYRPVFDVIHSPSIGGAGAALVAGIDCAAELQTLRQVADGMKNPKTGKCEGVSSAMQLTAIPAFVNDIPAVRTAAK
jgi:hypothetical protein